MVLFQHYHSQQSGSSSILILMGVGSSCSYYRFSEAPWRSAVECSGVQWVNARLWSAPASAQSNYSVNPRLSLLILCVKPSRLNLPREAILKCSLCVDYSLKQSCSAPQYAMKRLLRCLHPHSWISCISVSPLQSFFIERGSLLSKLSVHLDTFKPLKLF